MGTRSDDARHELRQWGAWWRNAERRGLGNSAIGPGQRLIELARLGCQIQNAVRHDRADNIQVPLRIRLVDDAVERLPMRYKKVITAVYVLRPHARIPRGTELSRMLLRAEDEIGEYLSG